MNQIHPKPVVMGVGTAMGAVMLGVLFLGCQPGSLPCDKDEWKEVCALENGGGGGAGGNSMPPPTGMGGSSAPAGPPKCPKYNNSVKEVAEKLIMPTCGGKNPIGCHGMGFDPKFATANDILGAAMDKPGKFCTKDLMVNKMDPSKSLMVTKVKAGSAMHTCPTPGGIGGARMPFNEPALGQDDIDCLEWWAHEVSK
jgi:hypothetical protein